MHTVFISYSHKDEKWKDRLVVQLRVLQEQRLLRLWNDRRLEPGEDWHHEIMGEVNKASVAVLLISANFLTSSFILRKEVVRLLDRRRNEGLRIVPIIVEPCDWEAVPWLRALTLLPRDGRPLSTYPPDKVTRELAAIAVAIRRMVAAAPSIDIAQPPLLPPERVVAGALPVSGPLLIGRSDEMRWLDCKWEDSGAHIICLVGWGGVGKTALISHWLQTMAADHYRKAETVFVWSFYSQGTGDRTVTSDLFMSSCLKWFGDKAPDEGSAWDRATRLADLVRRQRTLLVLDGIEPLQQPPGPQEGRLKDHAFLLFLRELAAHNPGLCVITTRLSVSDLLDFKEPACATRTLSHLLPKDGAQYLRSLGVRGTDPELEEASRDYDGHCLALTLLGNCLVDLFKGDIHFRNRIGPLTIDVRRGGHARRVLAFYGRWFKSKPELDILYMVALFDRPASPRAIDALREPPAIENVTEYASRMSYLQWRAAIARLQRAGLLTESSPDTPEYLDSHALVKEYFSELLCKSEPIAWRTASSRLFEHFKTEGPEWAETIEGMEPLFLAVMYGCRAGRQADALNDVYVRRLMRGKQRYLVRRFGAMGHLVSCVSHFFEDGDWGRLPEPRSGIQGLDEAEQRTLMSDVCPALIVARGMASNEVRSSLKLIGQLSQSTSDARFKFQAVWWEWSYHLVRADLQIALRHVSHLGRLTRSCSELAGLQLQCNIARGITITWMGQLSEAKTLLEKSIELYEPDRHPMNRAFGKDPRAICSSYLSGMYWLLGQYDDSTRAHKAALRRSQESGHVPTRAVALYFSSWVCLQRRLPEEALKFGNDLLRLCREHGLWDWAAVARIICGHCMHQTGDVASGLSEIITGMGEWRRSDSRLNNVGFQAMLAEVYLTDKQYELAQAAVDVGLRLAEQTGERYYLSELFRVRGELSASMDSRSGKSNAAADLLLALHKAQDAGAKALALRAAVSLARLQVECNQYEEARAVLSNVCYHARADCEEREVLSARRFLHQVEDQINGA